MLFRHVLALVVALSAVAPSAHAAYKCSPSSSSDEFMSAFTGELDRLHAAYKVNESAHQARLEAGAKTMIDSGAWSKADKSAFFLALLEDPDFLVQEKQKKYYSGFYQTEMPLAFTLGETSPSSACGHATNTVKFLGEIVAASEKQWTLMEERLNQAAAAKGVELPAAG